MALDKQKILYELGSVMNQLQNTDCGCMDKLFTKPGEAVPSSGNNMVNNGGFGHGCCHGHEYGHHHGSYNRCACAGEPYTAMNANSMGMGRCNPPKLYADTYNYLNQNLMQPVVKEVYNDLKNLTPHNAVANNSIAGQMGLSAQSTTNPMTSAGMGNQMQSMSSAPSMIGNQMMATKAGMGPQIVNMMTGDTKSKLSNTEGQAQGGALTGPMIIDAPNSPHGQVGVTPLNQSSGYNQAKVNPPVDAFYDIHGYSNLQPQNQTMQNMCGADTEFTDSQMNPGTANMFQNDPNTYQMGNINSNPAAQQMSGAQRNPHGLHAQGIAKFNERFPGVMQGLGGDLGFDPMAIAIQMNPANQQKVAMDTMQKIMNGTNVNKAFDSGTNSAMQPGIIGAKAAAVSLAQPLSSQVQVPAANQQIRPNQQALAHPNEIIPGQNQQAYFERTPNQSETQQKIYTAVTGNSILNPQEFQGYSRSQQQLGSQAQKMIDPRLNMTSHMPESTERRHPGGPSYESNHQNTTSQAIIKDPLFPVDTSKNSVSPSLSNTKYFEYNTLGQPVEMLPAKMYYTREPNLPQTLSPQLPSTRKREEYMKYSDVKSTVSKTSLMANRPVGKVPSRNQLQHIYNQYKGSQSFTQQNIRAPAQGVTHSEGHIAANKGNSNQQRQAPVENVGDVVLNNAPPIAASQKVKQVMGHIGDASIQKSLSLDEPIKASTTNSKLRNGLQDIVYTSYPTSAAWSFHGNNHTPYCSGRRSRFNRA